MLFKTTALIVLFLSVMCRAATQPAATRPADIPEAREFTYIYDKAPRWSPWIKVPENKYHYLIQTPPKISPDAPILIFMHIAGAHEQEGMGLEELYVLPRNNWFQLRRDLLQRGWIYVSPEIWEFDGLQADLLKRFGKRKIYLMGGSWGGLDVFQEARFKLRQDPKAYDGVALLASAIDIGALAFRRDLGPGAVVGADFPVPVYLAVGGEEKLGGAMFKLYLRLAAAGTTVHMDIYEHGNHPPSAHLDWNRILDFLSGKNTGEHSLVQWNGPYPHIKPEQIDPLPPGATTRNDLILAPEPALRKSNDISFWYTEPVKAYPNDTPMLIFVPEIKALYFQAFGRADGRVTDQQKLWPSGDRIAELRLWCYNAGWPYIVPDKGDAASQFKAMTAEAGPRSVNLIAIGDGGDLAIGFAKCDPKRVSNLILFHPSVDEIKAASAMTCPAVITTATDCSPEQADAARAFIAAAREAKRSAIWISDQGGADIAKGPATEYVNIADVIKRLGAGGVQELKCGEKIGSLSDVKTTERN